MQVLNRLTTKDLWQSAFMLAQGLALEDIQVRNNPEEPNGSGARGKREVYFVLAGDNICRLAREFRSGRASCNVSALRASMIHLKEEMYKVMRP